MLIIELIILYVLVNTRCGKRTIWPICISPYINTESSIFKIITQIAVFLWTDIYQFKFTSSRILAEGVFKFRTFNFNSLWMQGSRISSLFFNLNTSPATIILVDTKMEVIFYPSHFQSSSIWTNFLPCDTTNLKWLFIPKVLGLQL